MTKKGLLGSLILILVISLLSSCVGKTPTREQVSFLDFVPSRPDALSDYPLEQSSGKTAFNYFKDEKIFSGINLGNTLDSHNFGIGEETIWGNPPINQDLMNGIKAAGFNIVRIPVTWMGSIGLAPDYRVSSARLKRVAEVAEMANKAGLKAIINVHHDGSTQSGGKDLGWLSIFNASRKQDEYNRITMQFVRLWKQIALYFQNYGDWLVFEGFNELHDGNWQTCNDFRQFTTLALWNQLFVDTVRSSGGNNESRFLMVNAYCADHHQALSGSFKLPDDKAEGRLILSFHYYTPSEFAINGRRTNWGTDSDKRTVENDFAPFKERFIEKNIPVVIGECGAVLQLYPNDPIKEKQAQQSRSDYLSYVFSMAKKYALVPVYWENGATRGNGEKFGLFDRRTGKPNSPESEALIKLILNAVK